MGLSMEYGQKGYVGADRYERVPSRLTHRNGYYQRDLETELGLLRDIRVPRTKDGGYRPTEVFRRYKRRQTEVDKALREMFLSGVPTRKVGEVLEVLTGYKLSAQTVSQATKELDREVRKYHTRPLADYYKFLLLDGVVLRVKGPRDTGRGSYSVSMV